MLYATEKFVSAQHMIETGDGDLRTRVCEALREITGTSARDVPDELRDEVEAVRRTNWSDYLVSMETYEVQELASRICRIANELHRYVEDKD